MLVTNKEVLSVAWNVDYTRLDYWIAMIKVAIKTNPSQAFENLCGRRNH